MERKDLQRGHTIVEKFKNLFQCDYPIIQAGMVWVSGAKLAAAAANEGIIGTIGAGSMTLELLDTQIKKARSLIKTNQHLLAVNFPLIYHKIEEQIEIALKNDVKIFIASAGNPKKFTSSLKSKGKLVIHVCSSSKEAIKCEQAGVDAIVAEGYEAGGHNGRNETTTLVLIPQVVDAVKIPVIAAGGIADYRQIKAAHALGASAVQIGSRFLMSEESSAHENFKNLISKSSEGDTRLLMKKHIPVRLLNNQFSEEIKELEANGATTEKLIEHLGKGRAKNGMLLGDIKLGELEVGQVASMLQSSQSVAKIMKDLKKAYI